MNQAGKSKLAALKRLLRESRGLAVAFSGGLDSTFLAAAARRELGDRTLAVTAASPLHPETEQREAARLAAGIGIRHETVTVNQLEVPGFAENPPNRCYLCKNVLFRAVRTAAERRGITAVADGTNADDRGDYRPGRKAAMEQGVLSPLLEVGLTKAEIRRASAELGLPTAGKPPFACLASRFPYGVRITLEKLAAVTGLEEELRALGFAQFRVRHHGDTARIEVDPGDIERLAARGVRDRVVAAGRRAGFVCVTLDLQGYRTGSMNETLTAGRKGSRS